MDLVDALKAPPKPKRRMQEILEGVSPEECTAILEALNAPMWTDERLARVLTDQGHAISESSIRRYRRDILGMRP